MTRITGDLKLVTNKPADVTRVLIRARDDRPTGTGVVLDVSDTVPVTGGKIDVSVEPGPAVMVLMSGQRAFKQLPLYVAGSTQTLGNAVAQGETIGGRERTELESLMRQVAAQVASVASTTKWSGDRLVVNGKTSPSLTGPQGPPGPTKWDKITGKPATYPPAPHTHTISQVSGLAAELGSRPNGWIIRFASQLSATEKKARPGDLIHVIETAETWEVS